MGLPSLMFPQWLLNLFQLPHISPSFIFISPHLPFTYHAPTFQLLSPFIPCRLPHTHRGIHTFLSRRALPLRKHPFCHCVFRIISNVDPGEHNYAAMQQLNGEGVNVCWWMRRRSIGVISVPSSDIVITLWATECPVPRWCHGKLVLAEDQWYSFSRLLANWKTLHMTSREFILLNNWSHLVSLYSEFSWYCRKHDLSSSCPRLFTLASPGRSVKGWQMRHMLL